MITYFVLLLLSSSVFIAFCFPSSALVFHYLEKTLLSNSLIVIVILVLCSNNVNSNSNTNTSNSNTNRLIVIL